MAEPVMTAAAATTSATSTPTSARRGLLASLGAVAAAFLASLCCVGPLAFVFFGVGAGLASTFEPLRPVFTALTLALLAVGFYVVYGRRPAAAVGGPAGAAPDACGADGCAPVGGSRAAACVVPRNRTRDKVLLWLATVLALVFLTFPQWSLLFV